MTRYGGARSKSLGEDCQGRTSSQEARVSKKMSTYVMTLLKPKVAMTVGKN